jgi:uncharacterized protein YjgD (DUF1641 family)
MIYPELAALLKKIIDPDFFTGRFIKMAGEKGFKDTVTQNSIPILIETPSHLFLQTKYKIMWQAIFKTFQPYVAPLTHNGMWEKNDYRFYLDAPDVVQPLITPLVAALKDTFNTAVIELYKAQLVEKTVSAHQKKLLQQMKFSLEVQETDVIRDVLTRMKVYLFLQTAKPELTDIRKFVSAAMNVNSLISDVHLKEVEDHIDTLVSECSGWFCCGFFVNKNLKNKKIMGLQEFLDNVRNPPINYDLKLILKRAYETPGMTDGRNSRTKRLLDEIKDSQDSEIELEASGITHVQFTC